MRARDGGGGVEMAINGVSDEEERKQHNRRPVSVPASASASASARTSGITRRQQHV